MYGQIIIIWMSVMCINRKQVIFSINPYLGRVLIILNWSGRANVLAACTGHHHIKKKAQPTG